MVVGPFLRTLFTMIVAGLLIWASFVMHPATLAGLLIALVLVGAFGATAIVILLRKHD